MHFNLKFSSSQDVTRSSSQPTSQLLSLIRAAQILSIAFTMQQVSVNKVNKALNLQTDKSTHLNSSTINTQSSWLGLVSLLLLLLFEIIDR